MLNIIATHSHFCQQNFQKCYISFNFLRLSATFFIKSPPLSVFKIHLFFEPVSFPRSLQLALFVRLLYNGEDKFYEVPL